MGVVRERILSLSSRKDMDMVASCGFFAGSFVVYSFALLGNRWPCDRYVCRNYAGEV